MESHTATAANTRAYYVSTYLRENGIGALAIRGLEVSFFYQQRKANHWII